MLALEGLSTGDAFGEQLLHAGPATRQLALGERTAALPGARRWMWTDDTAMAVSIVETLALHDGIDVDDLARRFANRYVAEPARGYGRGAHHVLAELAQGVPWEIAARSVFDGQGSCGNGGGMRSAPVGAYFCTDLVAAAEHAARSAAPTHAHPDGVAGAVAVAIAAARVFAGERDPRALLEAVVAHTPSGPTRDGVRRAIALVGAEPITAAAELGNGSRVLAADTIPFAIWCAATNLENKSGEGPTRSAAEGGAKVDKSGEGPTRSAAEGGAKVDKSGEGPPRSAAEGGAKVNAYAYANALWSCASVGGDIDTTCAMAGGIIVGAVGLAGIPAAWRAAREPLP
ncbi:MAG: ADP-ribosylglycohydrolase family protein [Kofleriaceae bacterium]